MKKISKTVTTTKNKIKQKKNPNCTEKEKSNRYESSKIPLVSKVLWQVHVGSQKCVVYSSGIVLGMGLILASGCQSWDRPPVVGALPEPFVKKWWPQLPVSALCVCVLKHNASLPDSSTSGWYSQCYFRFCTILVPPAWHMHPLWGLLGCWSHLSHCLCPYQGLLGCQSPCDQHVYPH